MSGLTIGIIVGVVILIIIIIGVLAYFFWPSDETDAGGDTFMVPVRLEKIRRYRR